MIGHNFTKDELDELSNINYKFEIKRILSSWINAVKEMESETFENQYWGVPDDHWNNLSRRVILAEFLSSSADISKILKEKLSDLIVEYDRRFLNATQELNDDVNFITTESLKWMTNRIPKYPGKDIAEIMRLEHPNVDLGIQNAPK